MCGIAGILRTKKAKFDYQTFCTLGIANDSRGGDSCGVFIDGETEYGTFKEKYFQDFFQDSKVINAAIDKEVNISLVHCRKASVGVVSEKTAQPVVLRDKAGNVRFVLLHNGTIWNYEELAKKYIPNIDIKGLTDSQVMARIFYYKGYDCLSEYYGGSVFVIVDYRQPQPLMLFFKGASRKSDVVGGAEVEERPFYFVQDEENEELIFSSISPYLAAARPGKTVYTISANNLIRFNGKDILIVKEYSRKERYQSRPTIYTSLRHHEDYYGAGLGGWNWSSGGYSGYTSRNIKTEDSNNTYSEGGKKANGMFNLTIYGRIVDRPSKGTDTNEVWFFQGIALRKKKYYRFLEKMCKKTRLSPETFANKYQNLVRYLSIDKLYFKDRILVEAISPTEYVPASSTLQMLGETKQKEYKNGTLYMHKFSGSFSDPFKMLDVEDNVDLNEIRKICK